MYIIILVFLNISIGYELVFVKALPKNMKGPLGMAEYIPRGYIHTFIIRTPEKAISSLYQIMKHEGETTAPLYQITIDEGEITFPAVPTMIYESEVTCMMYQIMKV